MKHGEDPAACTRVQQFAHCDSNLQSFWKHASAVEHKKGACRAWGQSMQYSESNGGWQSLSCMAHNLQLIVTVYQISWQICIMHHWVITRCCQGRETEIPPSYNIKAFWAPVPNRVPLHLARCRSSLLPLLFSLLTYFSSHFFCQHRFFIVSHLPALPSFHLYLPAVLSLCLSMFSPHAFLLSCCFCFFLPILSSLDCFHSATAPAVCTFYVYMHVYVSGCVLSLSTLLPN